MSQNSTTSESKHRAGLFDIRIIIGSLLGVYGVILVIVGLFVSDAQIRKSDSVNLNLIGGIAMVIAAAAFILWARLRPIIVPDEPATDAGGSTAGH